MVQSNRLRLYTSTSSAFKTVDVKKYRMKNYLHIDGKISFHKMKHKITNPCWIKEHGFLPFIHYQIKHHKYDKKTRIRKDKVRDINYSSHKDSYIYKYYGEMLNEEYNKRAEELGIDSVATAYRNNKKGKSNIHFAKEVIDFIKVQKEAYIYVADFTSFFDNLDHHYLKKSLKEVLNVANLPDDYYAIYKNLTKYSYIEKSDIENYINNIYGKEELKQLTRYFRTDREFREFKAKHIKINKKYYGIPQGAGLSAVCSNLYLMDFDAQLNHYVISLGGIYRRYSDDMVIVLPTIKPDSIQKLNEFVERLRDITPRLEIQKDKTDEYYYINEIIYGNDMRRKKLDYLGFVFDGKTVKIRDKSIFKYYSRTYKKIRICNSLSGKYGRKSYRRSLYKTYTHLGRNNKGHGNFISYVERAQRVFDDNTLTKNLMKKQTRKHWRNISKRLRGKCK